jgi:hypothetical protein
MKNTKAHLPLKKNQSSTILRTPLNIPSHALLYVLQTTLVSAGSMAAAAAEFAAVSAEFLLELSGVAAGVAAVTAPERCSHFLQADSWAVESFLMALPDVQY